MTELVLPDEDDVLVGRLAHPDAQAAMGDEVQELVAGRHECGWVGTSVLYDRGSFALVDPDGPLAALVGDYVRLRHATRPRAVRAYVVGSLGMDVPIAVTRRTFLALAPLFEASASVQVEVLR